MEAEAVATGAFFFFGFKWEEAEGCVMGKSPELDSKGEILMQGD